MSDEEARAIREDVIRALAQEGEDVSGFEDADEILARAGGGTVPLLDESAVVQNATVGMNALVDSPTDGTLAADAPARNATTEASSPALPESMHARMLSDEEALEAVFADVRTQSRRGVLVQPTRWAALGLVPRGQTAEEFEMFVYEYLEEHAPEAVDGLTASAARTATRAGAVTCAPAPKARSATATVGMSRFVRARLQEEQAEGSLHDEDEAASTNADASIADAPREDVHDADALREDASREDALGEDASREDARGEDAQGSSADGIVALTGAHSYYLYARDVMTDTFARWAFLANEDDKVVTFAECVRQESRTYPRPMDARALCNDPFNYRIEDVEALWGQIRDAGEHPDLDTVTASNGDVYYFSTDYLKPAYAASLAEWNSVERDMYL